MSESFEQLPGVQKAFANAGLETNENVDNGDTGGASTETGTNTESGSSESGTTKTDKVQGDAGKDSFSSKPDGGKKPGKEEKGKDTSDPNDLKLQDGTIIKAGAERRWYEDGRIAKQKLANLQGDFNRITQEHNTLKTKYSELENTVKAIGFEDPKMVTSAVALYKDLGRDLPGTMQKLLAEAKAAGYTFEGVGGTIDTAAISRIIDERLPKSSQGERRELTKEEVDRQASDDVNDFLQKFPDALTHEAHIAALIDRSVQAGRPLSLTDAYYALRQRVVDDGMDWSQPLGPQIAARKSTQQSQDQQQQQPKPRTGGRSVIETASLDPDKIITPERELDTDSIVSAAMREAGFNINR